MKYGTSPTSLKTMCIAYSDRIPGYRCVWTLAAFVYTLVCLSKPHFLLFFYTVENVGVPCFLLRKLLSLCSCPHKVYGQKVMLSTSISV
jgi:hypothetical protein